MKDNMYDEILEGVEEIVEEVSDDFVKTFKGVIPFDKTPISSGDILKKHEMLSLEERDEMNRMYGPERMVQFDSMIQNLNRRRNNGRRNV